MYRFRNSIILDCISTLIIKKNKAQKKRIKKQKQKPKLRSSGQRISFIFNNAHDILYINL